MNIFGYDWSNTISFLGCVYAFKLVYSLAVDLTHGVRAYVLPTLWAGLCNSENFVSRFGTWAIVTGCTQGIGRAYVSALAGRGMNIVLVSRDEKVLEKLASETLVTKLRVICLFEAKFNHWTKLIFAHRMMKKARD